MSSPETPIATCEVTCPSCFTLSLFQRTRIGSVVECPICSASMPIVATVPVAAKQNRVETSEPASTSRGQGKLILGCVVVVVLFVAGSIAVWVLPKGTNGETSVARNEPIQPDSEALNQRSAGPTEDTPSSENTSKVAPVLPAEPAGVNPPDPGAIPHPDPAKKSLVAPPTVIQPFEKAGQTAGNAPKTNFVPVPPVEREPTEIQKPTEQPTPAEKTPLPSAPKAAVAPAPVKITVPTIMPKTNRKVACSTKGIDELIDYEIAIGTLKANDLVNRKQVVLIAVPTQVKIEAYFRNEEFVSCRPVDGPHQGKLLFLRSAMIAMPK